jgi:hypothetical protein
VHFVDQAEFLQFVEALPDLAVQRARGQRHDAVVRRLPAQLLRHLVAERLRAFGVVRAHVDVDEGPLVLVAQLGAEAVHVVVRAVDRNEVRAIDLRAEHFAGLEVAGAEDERLHARASGVGGDGVREVSGRSAGERLEAELACLGCRDRDHAVLERPGRVDAVVLQPEFLQAEDLAQVVGAHERREPSVQVDRLALAGQQVTIAPDGLRALVDALARNGLLHRLVVVGDFERAEAELADVDGAYWILAAALATAEGFCEGHWRYLVERSQFV